MMGSAQLSKLAVVLLVSGIWLAGTTAAQAPPTHDYAVARDRALQLARAHRFQEAEAALRGVPAPADSEQRITFLRLKAAIASGLGRAHAAAEDMETAAQFAPANKELRLAAEIARLQADVETRKDARAILKSLRSAVRPPKEALAVRLRMAEILGRAGRYAEAATDLASAAGIAPDRADIHYNLALALFRTRQWEAAMASAERAKALEDSGSLESLIGDIQEQRGDSLAAVHGYQAAVALEPSEESYRLALALELLRHQTFDAGIIVLEQAKTLFPKSARAKILLGLSYYLVDRSQDAVAQLLEAMHLAPQDATAARYLGEITLTDSAAPNPDAVAQLCQFADTRPQNRTANAFCGSVLLRLARDSSDASRQNEIIRRLEHAVRGAPDEPVARCHLGMALQWTEQWQRARTQMEACVKLEPKSPEWHYNLSRIYRRLGLSRLSSQQTLLQEQAAARQSEESVRRANSVTRFLVLLKP